MKRAKSYGIDVSLLNTCSNEEEADTMLISHALHVFQIVGKITFMTFDRAHKFAYLPNCTNTHCWDQVSQDLKSSADDIRQAIACPRHQTPKTKLKSRKNCTPRTM